MQVGGGAGAGPARVHPIPDLREGSNDNPVIVRRIQLQETVEQLFQIIFRVNLLLQNHLQHGLPEIQIRVVRIFLHRHAGAADSAEPLHRPQALDVRVRVGGVAHRWGVDGGGEGGGVGVPRAGGGVVAGLAVGGVWPVPWPWVEHGGEFRPSATAAAS